MNQEKLAKLPKWAQEEIKTLEASREGWKKRCEELNRQHPGSNVELDNYVHGDTKLPPDSEVGFYLGESRQKYRNMITVNHIRSLDNQVLNVSAHGGLLVVHPWATNVIRLKVADHR